MEHLTLASDPGEFSLTVSGPAGAVRVHVWPARPDADDTDAHRRPVLLACHGWTDSGAVFGSLARALGRRWTVVAPDAPGHGGTPWTPASAFVVAEHAAGVLDVLDRLPATTARRTRVVALGHSMGALTAARVAAARPGVVRHLVLEDPTRTTSRPSGSVRRNRPAAQSLRRLRAMDQDGRIAALRSERPHWPDDEHAAWASSKLDVDLRQFDVPIDWGEPLVALLADVPCPVTIIRGDRSRGGIVSAAGARRCAAACRSGAQVIALDAGHNPRREAREPFIAALAAVLGRHED